MNLKDIRTLYAYDRWANRCVVAKAGLLDAEDFTRDLKTSHGSIRGTLVHILGSEWFWLELWRGESFQDVIAREPEWEETLFTDVSVLEARWSIVERDLQVFLEGLTEEVLKTRMSFNFFHGQQWDFPLADYMQHVVNHSSYHRGQVITLLRQLGHTPPATDYLVFLRESAAQAAGYAEGS